MALSAPSVPTSTIAEILADLDAGLRPTVSEVKAKIASAKPPKAAEAPASTPIPAAERKSSYQSLVDLLKKLGLGVARDALKEAFAGTKDYQPGTRLEPTTKGKVPARQPTPYQSLAPDDDQLADFDLSSVTVREAA